MKAILTYHSIDGSQSAISIAPQTFETHLRWLVSGAVRVLPLDDLIAHPAGGGDAVAVTFDDGFRNIQGPLERLRAEGLPATVFVVTNRVGRTNAWGDVEDSRVPTLPLLTWAELSVLAGQGVAIAAHTRRHPVLTALTPTQQDDELGGCGEDLRSQLGIATHHLAYPYGAVDDAVAARVKRHYRFGYTTEFRPLGASERDERLPRLDMYYFQAPGLLETWGRPRFTAHVGWCRARRRLRHALVGGAYPGAGRQWRQP